MKPQKIGYILKRYPRFTETFVVNEILAHEAAGWDIEIFSLRTASEKHFQDVLGKVRAPVNYIRHDGIKGQDLWDNIKKFSRIDPTFWRNLSSAQEDTYKDVYQALVLTQEIQKKGIDRLHAHFATAATSVARLAAKFAGIPFTFTAHAKDIFHEDVNPEHFQRMLDAAAGVVTVSDFNVERLTERYEAPADKIRRIYNGLDLKRFPYSDPEPYQNRIVAVGRLIEKKGFEYLIDACRILKQNGLNFDCQIIGNGPLEEVLRAQIDNLDLNEEMALLGPRSQGEIIEHVQNAAVFAAPCVVGEDGNRDGLPTVLLEAMALGTACVSTDVTGIPEVIQNEETGLLFSQNDPQALASSIARLFGDFSLRSRVAQNARRLIEEEFDIHSNTAVMREFCFEEALDYLPQELEVY